MEFAIISIGLLALALFLLFINAKIHENLSKQNNYLKRVENSVSLISNNLCNPKTRGAWGEEIAKNCLDKIGLKEGIDYYSQKTNEAGKRPDFSIVVKDSLVCNMDSKFPLSNYLRHCEAVSNPHGLYKHDNGVLINDVSPEKLKQNFLKDVKDRIKEVASKGYIDPKGGTTDFAICFIPNEQIVEFISSEDPDFLDHCLSHKVVICTPWTLYSIISLFTHMRSMCAKVENYPEIIKGITDLEKEWDKYKVAETATLKKGEAFLVELDELKGVRTRQLDKAFKKALK